MDDSASTARSARFEESKLTVKERLLALLMVYAPGSLMTVDALLEEYKGKERGLFRMLGKRFGLATDEALSIGAFCPSWGCGPGVLARACAPPRAPVGDPH